MTPPPGSPAVDVTAAAAVPEVTPPAAQPQRETSVGDARLTLLGTAHVSKASAEEVERLIVTGDYDAVAIELDEGRHASITDPDRWAKTDLFQVLRSGKAAMMAAQLALGAFQQRLAEQSGIEPGEEMRRAIRVAGAAGLPVLLIDRDIGVTLRRVAHNLGFWRRLTLFSGLLAGLVSREEVTPEEIEKLKEGDVLEATFAEFSDQQGELYTPLIEERDRYMAARLREEVQARPYRRVLVVVGAGHLKGLFERLEAPPSTPPAEELRALTVIPKSTPWFKLLPWLVVGLIIAGFVVGFSRDQTLGWQLVRDWVLLNGGLAAFGALIATAHPLTILASFVAAPFTSLNPLVGVGFVAAGLELWLRKPQMGDFATLRTEVTTLRGWWRNRVARTLLVFFLASLGSALGSYLAGFRILGRLL